MVRNPFFRERLREAVGECGLNRGTIIDRAGISKSTLSCYLSGYREPTEKTLPRLAEALRVNPLWLLGFTDDKEPVGEARGDDATLVSK